MRRSRSRWPFPPVPRSSKSRDSPSRDPMVRPKTPRRRPREAAERAGAPQPPRAPSRWARPGRAGRKRPGGSSRASRLISRASHPSRRSSSDPGKKSSPAASCASAASTAPEPMSAPGTAVADPSLIHVLRRLALIEARVRAAVARRRTTDPETDDRFRGLYISQTHVDRLLAERSAPATPDPAAAKAREEIEAAADAAEKEGADLRLRRLARNFRLDEIDIVLLLIATAPGVDARFERL